MFRAQIQFWKYTGSQLKRKSRSEFQKDERRHWKNIGVDLITIHAKINALLFNIICVHAVVIFSSVKLFCHGFILDLRLKKETPHKYVEIFCSMCFFPSFCLSLVFFLKFLENLYFRFLKLQQLLGMSWLKYQK